MPEQLDADGSGLHALFSLATSHENSDVRSSQNNSSHRSSTGAHAHSHGGRLSRLPVRGRAITPGFVRTEMRSLTERTCSSRSAMVPFLIGCCLLLASVALPAIAQSGIDAATAERRIKAAFLYKFAGYVEWPRSAFSETGGPFVIGVEGDDRIADELVPIVKDRRIAGRPVVVRKLNHDVFPVGVHVLFAADIGDGWLFAGSAQSQPTLVVTDSKGAPPRGSTINFVVLDGHVRFEISVADAEQRGLKVSARMLEVARKVWTGKPQ